MSSIMDNLAHSVREKPSDRNGFAVVVVILALLVMSVVAMAALLTADDDRRSSRAMRESSEAFYAAEAGLYEVLGTLDEGLVADLQPGDSVDLGWRTHDNGARYRAVLQRYDSGVVPKMFGLRVDGRGAGLLGGRRVVSLALESSPARLNLRAEGALVTTGNLAVRDETGVPIIDGNDNILPKRSCGTPVTAVSGVRIRDMALLSVAPGAVILGDLPTQQDPTIGNSTFTELGDLTYNDLVAIASKTYPPNSKPGAFGPVVQGDGTCSTSVTRNWGDPLNRGSPCSNYFPIIHFKGDVEFTTTGSAGQGIMLVDGDLTVGGGDFTFHGLIVVQGGCVFEYSSLVYGTVLCANARDIQQVIGGNAQLHYSECAVSAAWNGAIEADELASTAGPLRPLPLRAFAEPLR